MVTKTKRNAPRPRLDGPDARTPAAAPAETETETEADKPNLLRAGLKALGSVRDDVAQHQSRFFEAILGVEPGAGWAGVIQRDSAAAKLAHEALGLRKFEMVFDQRVASALERLGLPSSETVNALRAEVEALRAEVASLKAASPKGASDKSAAPKPPVRKRAAPGAPPAKPTRASRAP